METFSMSFCIVSTGVLDRGEEQIRKNEEQKWI